MGDITVRLTNTLDQDANDESIGYGDMHLEYDYNGEIPEMIIDDVAVIETSPADYDAGIEDPSGLWDNNCGATKKSCVGFDYYGGFNQCAHGHEFWRIFYQDEMHPGTNKLIFTGKIWTIDSWDGETFKVEMRDAQGNVLDT
jgi:hypothetical protein